MPERNRESLSIADDLDQAAASLDSSRSANDCCWPIGEVVAPRHEVHSPRHSGLDLLTLSLRTLTQRRRNIGGSSAAAQRTGLPKQSIHFELDR